MSPEAKQKLKLMLMEHEGFFDYPTLDTTGHLTIGYGYNLDANPFTRKTAEFQLNEHLDYLEKNAKRIFPFFKDLSVDRQVAFMSMCYNLGLKGILTFRKFLRAMELGDYKTARKEMLDSKWSTQVKKRAHDLAALI